MPRRQIAAIATELDRDLRAIRQILRRPAEAAVAQGGLTGPQQSAMRVLMGSDGMSLKDLARQLGLAHSTVSGIVDRLEKQGLVLRGADDGDLRRSRIVVADPVRKFMRETWPSLQLHPLAEALRGARPAQREEVLRGVRTLRELLERNGKSGPRVDVDALG